VYKKAKDGTLGRDDEGNIAKFPHREFFFTKLV